VNHYKISTLVKDLSLPALTLQYPAIRQGRCSQRVFFAVTPAIILALNHFLPMIGLLTIIMQSKLADRLLLGVDSPLHRAIQ
jgi:hypothetical protein